MLGTSWIGGGELHLWGPTQYVSALLFTHPVSETSAFIFNRWTAQVHKARDFTRGMELSESYVNCFFIIIISEERTTTRVSPNGIPRGIYSIMYSLE